MLMRPQGHIIRARFHSPPARINPIHYMMYGPPHRNTFKPSIHWRTIHRPVFHTKLTSIRPIFSSPMTQLSPKKTYFFSGHKKRVTAAHSSTTRFSHTARCSLRRRDIGAYVGCVTAHCYAGRRGRGAKVLGRLLVAYMYGSGIFTL
jgi:hypothetical protein